MSGFCQSERTFCEKWWIWFADGIMYLPSSPLRLRFLANFQIFRNQYGTSSKIISFFLIFLLKKTLFRVIRCLSDDVSKSVFEKTEKNSNSIYSCTTHATWTRIQKEPVSTLNNCILLLNVDKGFVFWTMVSLKLSFSSYPIYRCFSLCRICIIIV